MAQPAFGMASLYDPSIISDTDALQRQQEMADLLRRQALAPSGNTQMAGQIAIKNSPLEGLAQVFKAYISNKMEGENAKARGDLTAKQSAALMNQLDSLVGKSSPGQQVPQDVRPQGVSRQDMIAGGFPQPPDATQQQMTQQSSFEAQQEEIKRKARAALMMGNNELANKLIGNLVELTPEQKNMNAKGLNPRDMGQAELAKLRTEGGYSLPAGNTRYQDNKPVATAPDFGAGTYGGFNNGVPTLNTMPGIEALGQSAGAIQQGKAAADAYFKPQMVQNAAGASIPYVPQGPAPFGRGQSGQPGQSIPKEVLDASAAGPFTATQAPGGPVNVQPRNSPKDDPWSTVPILREPQGIGQTTRNAEFAKHLAKSESDLAVKYGDLASKAPDMMRTGRQVLDLLDKNPITGPLANQRIYMEQLFKQVGLVDGKRVADSQVLAAQLSRTTLDAIKASSLGAGNGFSNADRDFLEKAVGGNITLDSEALRRIAELNIKAGERTIQKATDLQRYRQMGGDPLSFDGWHAEAFAPKEDAKANATVVRKGKQNGRTVMQMSDGSIVYAD